MTGATRNRGRASRLLIRLPKMRRAARKMAS
jgi:hypothetical protein